MAAEQWEHLVVTMFAKASEQEDFLRREWPGVQHQAWAPQSLIPQLDEYGEQGWELVSLMPVFMGTKGDMWMGGPNILAGSLSGLSGWTNQYLCAFKRRKG